MLRGSTDLGLDPARVPALAPDAWRRLPVVDDDPSPERISVTDVWEQESEGLEWSDCDHRPLTVELLVAIAEEVVAVPVPPRLEHSDIVCILRKAWSRHSLHVCAIHRHSLHVCAIQESDTMALRAVPGVEDVVRHSEEVGSNNLQPDFFVRFTDQRYSGRLAKVDPSARQRPSAGDST